MNKFDFYEVKVFFITKKENLKSKMNDKKNKIKMQAVANAKVVRRDFVQFRGDLKNFSCTTKINSNSEKLHKYTLYTNTKINKIRKARKEKKEYKEVRAKAFYYVNWRSFSIWYHRVLFKKKDTYREFNESSLGIIFNKFSSILPNAREQQVAAVVLVGLGVYFSFESTVLRENALMVYADNQYVGSIEKENVSEMDNIVSDLIVVGEEEIGDDVTLAEDDITNIEFDLIPSKIPNEELITYSDVLDELTDMTDFKVQAYDVKINGESVGYVSDMDTYKNALEEYESRYIPEETDGVVVTDVEVQDTLTLTKTEVNKEDLLTEDELVEIFEEPIVAEKVYEVKNGDSLWQIANDNDLTKQELLDLNPGMTEEDAIYPGDELNIVKEVPRVSVYVTCESTFTDIAYRDVEEIPNDNEYVTYRKTVTEGSDGESLYTVQTKNLNGEEVYRNTLDEEVIVAPVSKVVEVGTLNTPPDHATGIFEYPATGRRTENFAARSGEHKGIDIANSVGTPVYASDGGVVTFAGWYGSDYGNLIIIDHENGYQTYYAHNSKLYVSEGDRVYQGENISAMGSTGRSTGSHCHFEIRKNGTPVNPDDYL